MANTFGTILSDTNIPDKSVYFEDSGTLATDTLFTYDTSITQLSIGTPNPNYAAPEFAISIGQSFGGLSNPDFLSINVQNTSQYGSSDLVVANDLDDGTVLTGVYGDFGIAGSDYQVIGQNIFQSNDVYLYSSPSAGNLVFVAQGTGKTINFATAGDTIDEQRMIIADDRTTFFANKDVELIPTPLVGGDWTATGGWSVTAGELVLVSNAGPNTIEPSTPLTITPGLTYYVVIEASAAAGTITYTLGGRPGTAITTGITTDFLTATTSGNLIITGQPTDTATITSVSVRALIPSTGTLEVQGGLVLGGGITKTSGAQVMNIDGDGVATFSQIPYVPVALPTQDYQVANKFYVDTFSQGLVPYLDCRLATTANITLSGAQSIDGFAVVTNDRILVKNQTAQEDNGIYAANTAGAWTRTTDFDTTPEVKMGAFLYVTTGTVNAGNRYAQYLFNPASDTLGVDPIAFTIISQAGFGVTSVSVVPANGFSGSVANPSSTPAITLSTTVTGLLQGNGSAISAVTIGSGLTFSSGTLSVTTGTFANVNLSNLASPTAINQHLLPGANDTYTLGNATFKWRQLRLSGGAGISIIADGHITTATPAAGGAFGFFAGSGAAGGGSGGAVNAGNGGAGGGAGGNVRAGDGATSFAGGDLIAGSSNGISGTGHGGDVWAGDGGGTSGRGGHVYSGNSFGVSDQGGDYIAGFGSSRSGSFITDSTGYFKGGAILLVDGSSNAIQINSPALIVTPYTLIMPNATGTGALVNDGLGNMSWVAAGLGDVVGPASATDNAIARFNLTTGKLIQNSGITVGDLTTNSISITTPTVTGTSTSISISGGNSTTANTAGGGVSIVGGGGVVGNANGGTVTLTGGAAIGTANGGAIGLTGGLGGSTSGTGGIVALTGGAAQAGNSSGGNLVLGGGARTGSGTHGVVRVLQASSIGAFGATLDVASLTANRTYTFPDSTGTLVLSNNITSTANGIGYATGAGGAVIQPTNKGTGVTLNKICGQITMNNAALNAGIEVSFTLTNSTIAANDVVYVCIASGGTIGSYAVSVSAMAAGSCSITLTNLSTTNLSQAVVLNFVVIKAVNA